MDPDRMSEAAVPNRLFDRLSRPLVRRVPRLEPLLANLGGELVRSAAGVFSVRLAGAALGYGVTALLVRMLGSFEFGIYAQLYVAANLIGLLLPIGLNAAVLRFIPNYRARGNAALLFGVISVSRFAVLLSAGIAVLILVAVALVGRDMVPQPYVLPLVLAIACLPLLATLDLYESFARGFGWTGLAYVPPYILQPLGLLAALALVLLAGGTLDAGTAMAALWVATAAALAVLAFSFHRRLRTTLPPSEPRRHARLWILAALPLVVVETSRAMMEQTDILLLGVLAKPEDVAAYFAIARTAGLLGFVSFAVGAFAVPRYSALYAERRWADLQAFIRMSLHLTFWPSLFGLAGLAVLGPTILWFFDPSFTAAFPALLILAGGLVIRAAAGPVEYLLSAAGDQRAAAMIYLIGGLANVGLNLLMIPLFGIIGAASATTASLALVTALLAGRAYRRLGMVSILLPRFFRERDGRLRQPDFAHQVRP